LSVCPGNGTWRIPQLQGYADYQSAHPARPERCRSQGQGTGKLAFIQPLFKRDTFVFLTLCAAALSCVGPMLCVFAAGAVGVLIAVLRTELRLAREAKQTEAAR